MSCATEHEFGKLRPDDRFNTVHDLWYIYKGIRINYKKFLNLILIYFKLPNRI
jgi:hypothetical protein